ncbi:MAG: TIGR00296 family protein [Candidatus Thermoplasmatota archaeon]|nr:TIGR00296 family protein [Candidatus Thermoplasmatota archaeon]
MIGQEYTDEDGENATKMARRAIEEYIDIKLIVKNSYGGKFVEKRGVFTTLTTSSGKLRGCVGFPEPVFPLGEAVIKSAISAASSDPRFPPVTKEEMDDMTVEVSMLSKPVALAVKNRKDLPSMIAVGRDGLIAERDSFSGLLLPQVAVEEKMDQKAFLKAVCWKAGMEPDCWKDDDTSISTFNAEVFYEVEPRGPVFRKVLSAEK